MDNIAVVIKYRGVWTFRERLHSSRVLLVYGASSKGQNRNLYDLHTAAAKWRKSVGRVCPYLLFLGRVLVSPKRLLVACPVAAGAVPVAQHTDGDPKQDVGHDEWQQQMSEILLPAVPCHNHFRIGTAVVAWEGLHQVPIAVLLSKHRTVDSWRITTALCVHVEPSVSYVPHRAVRGSVPPFAKWNATVVHQDLVTAQRSCGTSLTTRWPRAVPETLRVSVAHSDARDGVWVVIGHDSWDGGVHDERYEEEEGKNRHERGSTEA